jgi:hypothetical protein
MQKFWTWLKPKLVWILSGAGIVLGIVITIVTFGRSRPKFGKPPDRPKLKDVPDVNLPEVSTDFKTDLNDTVADDYKEVKAEADDRTDDEVMDHLNNKFK